MIYKLHEIRYLGVPLTKWQHGVKKVEAIRDRYFWINLSVNKIEIPNSVFSCMRNWSEVDRSKISKRKMQKKIYFCTWYRQSWFFLSITLLIVWLTSMSLTTDCGDFCFQQNAQFCPRKSVLKSDMIWNVTEINTLSYSVLHFRITWKR